MIYIYIYIYMSNGFYLVKQRIVLRRTPVCQKNHNQAVKRGRNTPRTRQASNVKHLAIKNKCSIGERGQTPQNVTGLENEVGTPRQLRFVPNNFRGSYIYRHFMYAICMCKTQLTHPCLAIKKCDVTFLHRNLGQFTPLNTFPKVKHGFLAVSDSQQLIYRMFQSR